MKRFLLILVALYQPEAILAQERPRRIFAVHSGVHIILSHPWKNYAAEVLRDQLLDRKIPGRDIVVLDCPFPTATIKTMVPREGVEMFLDSVDPASRTAQDCYLRMHHAFVKRGVTERDEIVWIGHSAGGQMGMTMAHLAGNLARYPDLAKAARPYRFHSVFTLGTPVGANQVPDAVRVCHYFSPQDKVVRIACDVGQYLYPLWGRNCTLRQCTMTPRPNCVVRCWHNLEHPEWTWSQRVLDRILDDLSGAPNSPWSEPLAPFGPNAGLVQLLGRYLENEHRICVEDLP